MKGTNVKKMTRCRHMHASMCKRRKAKGNGKNERRDPSFPVEEGYAEKSTGRMPWH